MSFTPVVRTSTSIPRSLLGFAKERNIDVKLLDYELISYETLMKRPEDDEYNTVQNIEEIGEKDFKNSATIIIQEYQIKIKPFIKRATSIHLSIGANKLKTKALITIKKNSIFFKKGTNIQIIKNLIWDKKLRAGLFINIFEDNLDIQLAKLLKIIPYETPLKKDLQFTVALGLIPLPPTDAKLEKIYEKKAQDSESIVAGIESGELIARYLLPKDGLSGRACNGKYLLAREPIISEKRPSIDETITEVKSDLAIKYYAKNPGYVLYLNSHLTISKTLKLESASFKSTGTIDAGDKDNDISVEIKHSKSTSEDAIGSGVKIDVKELNVDGSIAANVQIATQELNIDAQTHKNSKMEVENKASIKLHRGDLTANEAEIDVLESGKVTAHKSIYVRQMVGGTAIAPIVRVDELISNSTIIASELIEIKSILGFDNTLIINPHAIDSYHNDVEKLQEEIKEFTKKMDTFRLSLHSKIKDHTEQLPRVKTFQERMIKAKQSGRNPVKQDVIRIKLYKKQAAELALQRKELETKEESLQVMHSDLQMMYSKELEAKIISKTHYDGNSKVIFVNSQTKEEIFHVPDGLIKTISLVLNENGDRVIKLD